MNASHIKSALRMQYAAPQYATLEEVRNATGRIKRRRVAKDSKGDVTDRPRYADMIAVGLWPSLGLEILGFEVKTTRADWLKEIGDEKKAVAVQQYCDRWMLVVPHKNHEKIVRSGELPATWGMLTVDDDGTVREIVAAPKLDAQPITRAFLASLMRNACTSNPDYLEVQSRIIERRMEAMPVSRSKSGIKAVKRQTMNSQAAEIKRLKKVIADMELMQRMAA
jgi:polyhydroxyalkanoate synthesis regulator phasin